MWLSSKAFRFNTASVDTDLTKERTIPYKTPDIYISEHFAGKNNPHIVCSIVSFINLAKLNMFILRRFYSCLLTSAFDA